MQSLEAFARSLPGALVADRYFVDRVLGIGGMGAVVAATHAITGRSVALKLTPHTGDDTVVARFRIEAAALGSLDHPNVVNVFDAGYDQNIDCLYVAQEFLEGRTLEEELRDRTRLPWADAVIYLLAIAEALSAAHAAGIIHRDVKPSNVMLARKHGVTVPTLVDFGIAKSPSAPRVTATGEVFGTPHYMAPELARGERVDAQADIWGLGCILYESIAGNPPFDGDNFASILSAVLMSPVPAVRDVPANLAAIIAKCLERDLSRRYASMEEVRRDLRSVLSGMSEDMPTTARLIRVSDDGHTTLVDTSGRTTSIDTHAEDRTTVADGRATVHRRNDRTMPKITIASIIAAIGVGAVIAAAMDARAVHSASAAHTQRRDYAKTRPAGVIAPAPVVLGVAAIAPDASTLAPEPASEPAPIAGNTRPRSRIIVGTATRARAVHAVSRGRNGSPVFEP